MDLLVDPQIKKTYDKCKYIVKLWEHKFAKKHKRVPSKLDIREASSEVRHAYRKYFQLKTAALEQSFLDIEGFEDENDNSANVDESSMNYSSHENSNVGDNAGQLQSNENLENFEGEIRSDKTDVPDDVWGRHLNKTVEKDEGILKSGNSVEASNLNVSITKKLFVGSKFTKRNPRKSLSFSQRKSESFNNESPTFLSQPTSSFTSFLSEEFLSSQEEIISNGQNDIFKIVTPSQQISSQPVNIIQSVIDNKYRPLKSVDSGWLERVVHSSGTDVISSDCRNKSNETVLSKSNFDNKIDYDSDDVIEASDDEEIISQQLHIAKKIKTCNDSTSSLNVTQVFPRENKLPITSSLINDDIVDKTDVNTPDSDIKEQNSSQQREPSNELIININREELKPAKVKKPKKVTHKIKKLPKKIQTPETEKKAARRSTRQTKALVSMKDISDEELDPYYSETDDGDPLFTVEPDDYDNTEVNTSMSSKRTRKKPVKSSPKRTVKQKHNAREEVEMDDEKNETVYELEYCVRPRIVAPRYGNIKTALSKSKVSVNATNSSKSDLKEDKEKENKDLNVVKDKRQQDKEKLEQKILSGKLNENFVRIDLRKKVYVKGKKNFNYSKFKKMQWKGKKKALCGPDMDMGGCDGGMLTCFNCGQEGHFARNCKAGAGDGLLPIGADEEEACLFPTLEEASQMARGSILSIRTPKFGFNNKTHKLTQRESQNIDGCIKEDKNNTSDSGDDCFNKDDTEDLLAEALKLEEHVKKVDLQMYMDTIKTVKPYYEVQENNGIIDTPLALFKILQKFGHTSFRSGQEQAIMRILCGKSTLVTLSTGSGKSLCYQLPAYVYSQREPCISLVISPLVSLMEDQVTGIPSFLKAACLHTNQTKTQRQNIMDAIATGNLNILLISPEAVVAGEKSKGFGSILRKLPPIAFACIDEAHCVSHWSHNFRPSYLMICRVLREKLGVNVILGLTATATRATSDSIIHHLQIPDGREGIISDVPVPDNLFLTVSKDSQRDQALLGLLLSERFKNCRSVIVYCTRREECERVASFLRTCLKSETPIEANNKKRKRVNLQAEPYHAGLSASRRRTIQKSFMSGELRIVVATVAFGMGINKSDIRAVIHYNMPMNFESYVQEVGRAGRDGLPAHCHLFLDSQGKDENELRRHIHANSIDRHVIRKLLQKIFVPCTCTKFCPKHEVAFSIEETVKALDIPEENISTILCYLELHPKNYIELLSSAYTICKVISYGGSNEISKAAKECPPLAMALALHKNKDEQTSNVLEFPVIDVAAAMGWDSGICKHKLKNLEWVTVNNQPKRSTLSVQFSNLGFRLLAPGNLSDDDLDEALDSLYSRVEEQERKALLQLRALHQTVVKVAHPTYSACISEKESHEHLLKQKIREYFASPDPLKDVLEATPKKINEEQLVNDIHAIICMYRDNTFTGRAIARIFHGIQSPNYPAVIWGRCKFWRSHIGTDFHAICKIATREILKMR